MGRSGRSLMLAACLGLLSFLGLLGGVSYRAVPQPLLLDKDQFQLFQGLGRKVAEGWYISQPGQSGFAAMLSQPLGFPAENYGEIRWQLQGVSPEQPLRLIWLSTQDRDHLQFLSPTRAQRQQARVTMDHAHWQGQVLWIGLEIPGPLQAPVLFQGMQIFPRETTAFERWQQFFQAWQERTPWSTSSINFYRKSYAQPLRAPLVQIALWCGLSLVWFAILTRPYDFKRLGTALGIFTLIGWFALDLRWQYQLGTRLLTAYKNFGPLPVSERWRALPEADLVPFWNRIRAALPAAPVRLLILSDHPQSYLAQRLRYHLLPHNAYVMAQPPESSRPGDYLLILDAEKIRYDPRHRRLRTGRRQIPVKRLLEIPGVAHLYQVRKA